MDYSKFHDEKPCKACTSAEEMMMWSKRLAEKKKKSDDSNKNNQSDSENFKESENLVTDNNLSNRKRNDCPVDKDELGRSTWNLLHTMSVYYPTNPSKKDRENMNNMLNYLSQVYPCPPCAEDLRADLQKFPPNLKNREVFANWMCEMHNRVNIKLGKKKFDCNKVMERWYDGWKDGSCDN